MFEAAWLNGNARQRAEVLAGLQSVMLSTAKHLH